MRISDWSSDVCSADLPPSVLPDISPARGEIGWSADIVLNPAFASACADTAFERGACRGSISPLEGEMAAKLTEGVATHAATHSTQGSPMSVENRTTCSYCGVGCGDRKSTRLNSSN